MSASLTLRRRALLGGAGLTVVFGLNGCALLPPIPRRPDPTLEDAIGWIRLGADGRCTLMCPRMEMGQNIQQAARRVVARELGLEESAVDVSSPSTADIAPAKATVGSDSVRELLPLLSAACATLRAAQPKAGAAAAGVSPVAAGAAPLEALVTGRTRFTADIRLPGMLHACVLRPAWRRELGPRFDGVDDAALRAAPGFVRLLSLPPLDGPALVARHAGALMALRQAAKARWLAPAVAPDPMQMVDVDAALAAGRLTKDSGAVHDGPWTLDLRLDVPPAAHAGIEPRCALAHFEADGRLQVWCATQDPFFVRDVLARDHGLATSRVVVHSQRLGGSFGARTIATVEREAAFVAKAMGTPVRLHWSREDEFLGGFHRPPASQRIRVRLGADGRISDWWHALSSSHVLFTNAATPAWLQRVTDLIGDDGTARGQIPPYAVARRRLSLTLTRLPIATGPWRGLGAGPNVLAIESAMDAAARASGQDPVAFRLRHLEDAPAGEHLRSPARLAHVLKRAAAQAASVPLRTAGPGESVGRGVACGVYKGRSVAAVTAEVVISADAIRVTRLWCSHDCGSMIDPSGVRAQVEGNLVWSIALVLSDELAAPDGRPSVTGFGAYALPRMAQMPTMHIDLQGSNEPSSGAGETAIVAGAGAIFNAIAAASGRRPVRLPVRPADVTRSPS